MQREATKGRHLWTPRPTHAGLKSEIPSTLTHSTPCAHTIDRKPRYHARVLPQCHPQGSRPFRAGWSEAGNASAEAEKGRNMTTTKLSTLAIEQVEQIAAASEGWQGEQAARLDSAGIGEQMGDGRAFITSEHTEAIFAELWDSPTRLALRQLIADLEPKARWS
jgi:hypothetical protein